MKSPKAYARGKHAVEEAKRYAPEAVLKVFEDERGQEIAQISLARLVRPYEEFIQTFKPTTDTSFVFLAGVEDPHNVGAIIRSAAAFGASAVLMPTEGQAPITDTVFTVSAGMAFKVPLVRFEGYQQTLSDLRKRGMRTYALDMKGNSIAAESFDAPSVFIFGNEGAGVPNAVRPLCDKTISIPMHPNAESLNVAAAAAVTLYSWSAQHQEALKM